MPCVQFLHVVSFFSNLTDPHALCLLIKCKCANNTIQTNEPTIHLCATHTLLHTQTTKSEAAPAPITALVKTVSAQISNDHPDWEVNERRVAKFVKKTMTDPTTAGSGATGTTKKTTKFKFTSPIAKLKKKKAAKEESLASAIKEAAPAAKEAVSPVKMAAEDVVKETVDAAKETVETAKDAYKEEKESDSDPCCSGCVIC